MHNDNNSNDSGAGFSKNPKTILGILYNVRQS